MPSVSKSVSISLSQFPDDVIELVLRHCVPSSLSKQHASCKSMWPALRACTQPYPIRQFGILMPRYVDKGDTVELTALSRTEVVQLGVVGVGCNGSSAQYGLVNEIRACRFIDGFYMFNVLVM